MSCQHDVLLVCLNQRIFYPLKYPARRKMDYQRDQRTYCLSLWTRQVLTYTLLVRIVKLAFTGKSLSQSAYIVTSSPSGFNFHPPSRISRFNVHSVERTVTLDANDHLRRGFRSASSSESSLIWYLHITKHLYR